MQLRKPFQENAQDQRAGFRSGPGLTSCLLLHASPVLRPPSHFPHKRALPVPWGKTCSLLSAPLSPAPVMGSGVSCRSCLVFSDASVMAGEKPEAPFPVGGDTIATLGWEPGGCSEGPWPEVLRGCDSESGLVSLVLSQAQAESDAENRLQAGSCFRVGKGDLAGACSQKGKLRPRVGK